MKVDGETVSEISTITGSDGDRYCSFSGSNAGKTLEITLTPNPARTEIDQDPVVASATVTGE